MPVRLPEDGQEQLANELEGSSSHAVGALG